MRVYVTGAGLLIASIVLMVSLATRRGPNDPPKATGTSTRELLWVLLIWAIAALSFLLAIGQPSHGDDDPAPPPPAPHRPPGSYV